MGNTKSKKQPVRADRSPSSKSDLSQTAKDTPRQTPTQNPSAKPATPSKGIGYACFPASSQCAPEWRPHILSAMQCAKHGA
jgi:hypothetical protein